MSGKREILRDASPAGDDGAPGRRIGRRRFLGASAGAVAAAAGALTAVGSVRPRAAVAGTRNDGGSVGSPGAAAGGATLEEPRRPRAGRLKQAASRWPYRELPLPELARAARAMGLAGIDLLPPEDWPVVADAGLVCSMGYPARREDFISTGFNRPGNHPLLVGELEAAIPRAAREGVPNLIAMFGNRGGLSDAEAIESCVAGLERIRGLAEEEGVTVCLELLNSKVDHPDYQGDRTGFGAEVVRAVDSPRVKLLYDIYHMQIMEGDVIRTIREHVDVIAHFHTGGVPGRHELDDAQELNYRGIARAIAATGFDGFLAHEFLPTRDPLTSLREAVATCAVA